MYVELAKNDGTCSSHEYAQTKTINENRRPFDRSLDRFVDRGRSVRHDGLALRALYRCHASSMSLLNLTRSQLDLAHSFRNVARRAFYIVLLLLPGTVIVLPLLWWLNRRPARTLGRTWSTATLAYRGYWTTRLARLSRFSFRNWRGV